MKLYRKYIRPMHSYPGPNYEPRKEPIEKEEKWYPEEERERLEKEYGYLNEGHFSDLIFDVKYEPYAIEPTFKKLKVSEKCRDCVHCNVTITGVAYCHMASVRPDNPQMDISTIYVDPDSRPEWCPVIRLNEDLDKMSFEKRSQFERIMTGLSSFFGGENLWE